MKKYLLTSFLSLIAFVGFTNAGRSSSSDIHNCPTSPILGNSSDYQCEDRDYCYYILGDGTNGLLMDGVYLGITYSPSSSVINPYSSYNYSCSDGICSSSEPLSEESEQFFNSSSSFNITSCVYSESELTYSGDLPSVGGSSPSDSEGLLSGGTTALSGIISGLQNTMLEFIPYIAYLGLGLLGAIIGFVAIKRLINRIRVKILGTFSGGRRR